MDPIKLAKEVSQLREGLQAILLRAEAERDARTRDYAREVFDEFAAMARATLTQSKENDSDG